MAGDKKTPSTNQLKGSVKEAIGTLTDDARIEEEGERQKRTTKGRPAGHG